MSRSSSISRTQGFIDVAAEQLGRGARVDWSTLNGFSQAFLLCRFAWTVPEGDVISEICCAGNGRCRKRSVNRRTVLFRKSSGFGIRGHIFLRLSIKSHSNCCGFEAPRAGFEPATNRLTVDRSTAELPRNGSMRTYRPASRPASNGGARPSIHGSIRPSLHQRSAIGSVQFFEPMGDPECR